MLTINKGETKDLVFYLQPSLSNPVYLVSFVNDTTHQFKSCICANTVSEDMDFLALTFTEANGGGESGALGLLDLDPDGRWIVEVYEQTSTTNLDKSLATFLGDDTLDVVSPVIYPTVPERQPTDNTPFLSTLVLDINPADASTINTGTPTNGDPVSVIKDQSTFLNDLTQNVGSSQPEWVTDSINFDETNNEFIGSSSVSFNFIGSFTIGIWFNVATNQLQQIMGKNGISPVGNRGYALLIEGGSTIQFFNSSDGFDNQSISSSVSLVTSTWYYGVIQYDQTNDLVGISITAEGAGSAQTLETSSQTLGINIPSLDFEIGSGSGIFNHFDGNLGRTRAYNEARTQAQINADFLLGRQ